MNLRGIRSRTRKAAAKQLTRVFLYSSNAHADQSHPARPKPPDGFPAHMMIYDRFADEPWHWHPRDVDRLTREELFWLPVIRDAKTEAAAQLAAIEAAKNKD